MRSVVISIDAELAWGFHDRRPLPVERIRAGRRSWRNLVDVFDEYDLPATWAVVGHLFQDECEEEHAGHPAGPRPCTWKPDRAEPADLWFGGNLVESVRDAAVDHEISAHGYTHVHFDHERMHREFAESELSACVDAAAERGLSFDSFVFPVNRIRYRDLLAERGFTCYRGTVPQATNRGRKLVDAVRDRGGPPIVTPVVDEYGLVNVPASLNLFSFEDLARTFVQPLWGDPIANRVERGMEALAEREGVLHLWFHPHDLTRQRDFERLRAVLDQVERGRDELGIEVETMGQVAERVAASESGPREDP